MINTTTLKSRTARLLDSSVPRMSTTNALTRAAVACALVLATIGVLIPARAQNSAKTPPVAAAAAGPSTSATEPARAVTEPPPTVATPSATPTAPPEQAANAASGDVYSVGGDVSSPSVLSKVDPIYPEALKDLKVSGTVVLQVVVSADGIARDITVVRSDADGLDQSAVEAVQQWRFVPGQLNGEPVAVRARIEVNFKLL
jgi:TonB family protein